MRLTACTASTCATGKHILTLFSKQLCASNGSITRTDFVKELPSELNILEMYVHKHTKIYITTQQENMDLPSAKRARFSTEEVFVELEEDDEEPMVSGSDDEFEDMATQKRREMNGVQLSVT